MNENNNKNQLKYSIRSMQMSDCDGVSQLMIKLDFLASIYENQVMLKVDPKGTFVAQDINTGVLLGVCSGINLGPDLAFIGQYGVRPEYQNKGIGSALWRAAIEHIGPDRNISLFTMENMFDKYVNKSNFKYYPERRGHRFAGKADCSQLIESIDGISIDAINEDNIEKVIQYDRHICDGLDRTLLIREIAKISEYANGVAINQNQEVVGYCVIKVSTSNTGIVEPLYANDEKIAELLVAKCCRSLTITQTNGVVYPTWNTNHKSVAIAEKMGLQVSRKTALVFTKSVVNGNLDQIYCISNRCFYPF